jgi:hypothetical protein
MAASPGTTAAVVGRIWAWRMSVRTSPRVSGVLTVMTVPVAPARAVRPDRCR